LHRWFTTVAGASDLIGTGCLLALAWRPKQPLLFFFLVVGIVLAAGINLPFAPGFAIILAFTLPSSRHTRTGWTCETSAAGGSDRTS
jgi:hypothetical protein